MIHHLAVVLTTVLMIPAALITTDSDMGGDMQADDQLLIDFSNPADPSWRAINDGVMGGLSDSGITISDEGVGVFSGNVSLENNGGFASVRTSLDETDVSSFDGLAVRVAGDGKRYRIRLRTDQRFDGIAYQAKFDTRPGEWMVIEIPFDDFVPTFRGRTLSNVQSLDTRKICQIGFMIADKQDGRFRLDIAWVRAYKRDTPGGTQSP